MQITGSPALHDGRLFIPVSSAEEAVATATTYECCKFRGALATVDAANGKLLWSMYPAPAQLFRRNDRGVQMHGLAGGAIWPHLTVDVVSAILRPDVATGNSYTDVPFPFSDAVLALDEHRRSTLG